MLFCVTSAPAVYFHGSDESYVQTVLWQFVVVFIDGILVYFKSKTERADRLRRILQLLRGEKLYANFRCVSFGLEKVHFLSRVVNKEGIHLDSSK